MRKVFLSGYAKLPDHTGGTVGCWGVSGGRGAAGLAGVAAGGV